MSNKTVRLEIRKNVEVDVLIANAIKTLNEKGYTTLYLCSGHCENLSKVRENTHSMGTYVFFTPNEFLLFRDIPKKWQYTDSTIYRHYTDEEVSRHTPEQLLDMTMKELEEWTNELPNSLSIEVYNTLVKCEIL